MFRRLKVLGALACAGLWASSAYSRTIAVDSYVRDDSGRIQAANLKLSVGSSGYLYVGFGETDGGEDMAAWSHLKELQIVAPTTTNLTCALPTCTDGQYSHLRFFLVDDQLESPVPRYEYLQLNGEQWIDTPWPDKLYGHETVEMGVTIADVTRSSCVFCSRPPDFSPSSTFTLFYIGNTGWRFDYNWNGTARNPANANQKYSIVAHGTGLYVDDVLVENKTPFTLADWGAGRPVRMFASWSQQNTSVPEYILAGKFHSYRLWTNDTCLVANYIPTATNGVPCLYNSISTTAPYVGYKNNGTELAVLGPAKVTTNIICQSTSQTGNFGGGRMLKVLSLERTASERLKAAHLSVGPGERQWLYAGCGESDAGENLADWDKLVEIERIVATNVDTLVDIPASALGVKVPKYVRFFLLNKDYYFGEGERLESVVVDGSQYVQTDFVANQDSAIETEIKFATTKVSQAIFCARGQFNTERMCTLFYIAADHGWRYDFNQWQHASWVLAKPDTRYEVRAGTYSLHVNEREIFPADVPPNDFTTAGKMAIFASHNAQSGYGNNFRGELYSFRAWTTATNDTSKVLDLIPCRKNDTVYLYNKVDGGYLAGNAAMAAGKVAANAEVMGSAPTIEAKPEVGMMLYLK